MAALLMIYFVYFHSVKLKFILWPTRCKFICFLQYLFGNRELGIPTSSNQALASKAVRSRGRKKKMNSDNIISKCFISCFFIFGMEEMLITLYCLLRYFSHGSWLPERFHVTSGLWVAKRIMIDADSPAPAPIMITSGINCKWYNFNGLFWL